jgi:multisubunit Na+/H+ antiporter MnhG subunit
VLLAVTTPVAAHVVGQAARSRGEEMRTPGAVDETASRRS